MRLQTQSGDHHEAPPELHPGTILRLELPVVMLSWYILWVLFVPAVLMVLMSFAGQWAGNLTPFGPVNGALLGAVAALAFGAFIARYTGFRLTAGVSDPVISCRLDTASGDGFFKAKVVAKELT